MNTAYLSVDPPCAGRAAENIDIEVKVGGCSIYGQLLVAAGDGPHPTALLLHGFPGHEKNLDLAQALRRTGMNAAYFSYRGAWGSKGNYAIGQLAEDAAAVMQTLRDNAKACRADGRIWLIGHSMGGFAALHTLARGEKAEGAVMIAPCDLGMLYNERPNELTKLVGAEDTGNGCLNIARPGALRSEVSAHAKELPFKAIAKKLPHIPMLFVGATQDKVTPPGEHIAPLLKLISAEYRELNDGHGFYGSRIELISTVAQWLAKQV